MHVAIQSLSLLLLVALAPLARPVEEPDRENHPNVLLLVVDDLRNELGCYGGPARSPRIDAFAKTSVRFERAYCMVPTCGASRASLFTGVRPALDRFYDFQSRCDRDAPQATPLHAYFRSEGYTTLSLGKVLHVEADSAAGWSAPPWRPDERGFQRSGPPESLPDEATRQKMRAGLSRGFPFGYTEQPDDALPDGKLADEAIRRLRELEGGDAPFFLAVGFSKPHLPFFAPKSSYALYEHDDVRLPANYRATPDGAPPDALGTWGELRNYDGVPAKGAVSDDVAQWLIHGYRACVSFVDAQVGRVLDEVDALGLRDDTIVVLLGDHGWQLGEHTLWAKQCLFETSLGAPLLVRAPGQASGVSTRALVEFVDVYPTLCELAGLPLPSHLEGRSFAPLLSEPDRPWKEFTIARFRRGDSIKTDSHRYSEFRDAQGELVGRMLYDHAADPRENANVAELPEHRALVESLARTLHENMGQPRPERPRRGRR